MERGHIASQALANNLIGDPATRAYVVYLPPGYNTSDKRYPVVYVLHGYTGNETMFLDVVHNAMNQLLDRGEVREMILVFPDASNKLGGSWYGNSPTIGDYETFVAKDLVSLIDNTYRTLSTRDSRGITGCSMGGYGAYHLAFKFPDVFSVAAPMSGHGPAWEPGDFQFTLEPQDFDEFYMLDQDTQALISAAAVFAPNPDKPPFYLDMPYEFVGGEPQAVPEVFQKINTHLSIYNDAARYLDQPIRLRALMVFQDTDLGDVPKDALAYNEESSRFDRTLTEMGVEHDYVQVTAGHCEGGWDPILKFMDAHLAH